MFFPSFPNFTAIAFILVSILGQNFGELIVLRHPPGDNDYNVKLTCLAKDDDSALIWNYNPNEHEVDSGQHYLPAFKPERATPKHITGCAVWASTICIAEWNENDEWNAVSSTTKPMAPVSDHRWEGFKEFAFDKVIAGQEYLYVDKVDKSCGTVVFSVRGSDHIYIFLCKTEQPNEGPCIWIMLSRWHGTQSEIRSCANGAPDPNQTSLHSGNCIVLVKSQYESSKYLDAYKWRTFILKWNSAERSIKVFTDDHREPFLSATNSTWENVPHIFVRGERPSRFRFHFYEYFLAKNNNAILSTAEFIIHDENFCVEVLVGLCPECKLNVTLVADESRDIPIGSISGEGKSVHDKLMSWLSVRLTATLPNLNSKLVKLKMITILMKNEVEGQWAIDKFRKCKSVVGLRKSTITINREVMASANPFWPTVKCQKLSYTENIIVDSISGSPYRDLDGLVSRRKSRAVTTAKPPSSNKILELYEADLKKNSISLRLKPFHPNQHGIEKYVVSIENSIDPPVTRTYHVSQGLECSLWKESVCLEKILLPRSIISLNPPRGSALKIVVSGQKEDTKLQHWHITVLPKYIDDSDANRPTNPTWSYHGDGNGTLKWEYPSIPKTKIEQFNITICRKVSRLLPSPVGNFITLDSLVIEKVKKEYTKMLQLMPSTEYTIIITSINQINVGSNPVEIKVSVPSGVIFDTKSKLKVTNNGTLIELKIPAIKYVTVSTYIIVSMEGILTCGTVNNMIEWIVRRYKVEFSKSARTERFDANDTTTSVDMTDCFLNHGERYEINVKVIDEICNTSNTLPAHFITLPYIDGQTMPQYQGSNLIWLIIFPIMAIFLIPLCIWYRMRKLVPIQPRQPRYVEPISVSFRSTHTNNSSTHLKTRVLKPSIPRIPSYLEIIPPSPTTTPMNDWPALDTTASLSQLAIEATKIRSSDHVYTMPNAPDFSCVSMENFADYTKKAATSRRLHSQFMVLHRILPLSLCEYGRLPENVLKNRNEEMIPYDHSRVVLKKIPGDPHSDYINASYIKGYGKERAYIAAQGPKPNTVNDFWRMIWQEKVRVICMLTNVVEGDETKCEKYWPDVGTEVKYGVFDVLNIDIQVFSDYTFRTFELSYKRHTQKVTHLHYTGWPDLGVPTYPQSLVEYLRKLERTPGGNGPIVVHCSTGDDRTGTIILCAICLRQAVAEKVIDVMGVTARMRDSRANMVGTLQQYVLAHIIIMESLTSWPTQIPCAEVLSNPINKLRIQLPFDMERLSNTTWQLQALQSSTAVNPLTAKHLTNDAELLQDRPEVTYNDVFEREPNQINAVSVDGVKAKKQYLACWLPSPLTLPNFWQFIVERNIKLIIILQCSDPRNPTCCDIMLNASITVPLLKIEVEHQTRHDEREYFTIEKLRLTETSKANARSQSLTVMTCKGWRCGTIQKPPSPTALISLWRASEKVPRKEGQTLVLCHDGITGCGLYLAMSFLLERMAVERECDVISAIRAVRRSNPKFVQLKEQCEYLYDAAQAYAEYFECYANFS